MDPIIPKKEIQIERKRMILECRENDRGNFPRLMEESNEESNEESSGRRNAIRVPEPEISEFTAAMGEVIQRAGNAVPA
jgi:hypothetical protein